MLPIRLGAGSCSRLRWLPFASSIRKPRPGRGQLKLLFSERRLRLVVGYAYMLLFRRGVVVVGLADAMAL